MTGGASTDIEDDLAICGIWCVGLGRHSQLHRRRRKPPVSGKSSGSSKDQQQENSSQHHPTVIVVRSLRRAPPLLQPWAGLKFSGGRVDFGNKSGIIWFDFGNRCRQLTLIREGAKP